MDESAPVYERASSVLWRRTLDRVVTRHPATGETATVLGTGAAVWDALAEPRSLGVLARLLGEQFGVPAEAISGDLGPFLDDLARRGILAVDRG